MLLHQITHINHCSKHLNKSFKTNSHINEILLMNISNQDIVQSLRTIFDKCQKHVCALNSIGLDYWINFWSYAYKHYFQEIRQSKQASTELSSWKDFIDFLQKCYLVLENLLSNLNTFSNKPKYMSDHKNPKLKNLFVKKICLIKNVFYVNLQFFSSKMQFVLKTK